MNKMNFVLHVMILTSLIMCVKCLSCLDPRNVTCPDKGIVESQCPYGVAKDACNICWICAKDFKEPCGGVWNLGGTCTVGLRCSNPPENANKGENQTPGICCRTSQVLYNQSKDFSCPEVVQNQCSLETECTKGSGEICGGPGGIYGECGKYFLCLPDWSDSNRNENSTCIPLALVDFGPIHS